MITKRQAATDRSDPGSLPKVARVLIGRAEGSEGGGGAAQVEADGAENAGGSANDGGFGGKEQAAGLPNDPGGTQGCAQGQARAPEAKLSSKDAAFVQLLAAWPELALVRRAASANRPKRFRIEVEAVMGSARVAFAAALIAWRNTDRGAASQAVRDARRMYHTLRLAAFEHAGTLSNMWHLRKEQADFLQQKMIMAVGDPSSARATGSRAKPPPASVAGFSFQARMAASTGPETERFAHGVPFFIAALTDGWPLLFAIKTWSKVQEGSFSEDGTCVHVKNVAVRAAQRQFFAIPSACEGSGILIVCEDLVITHIIGKVSLRLLRGGSSVTGKPPAGQSNLLPDCIRLPIDPVTGAPMFPKHLVTTMYDARQNWDKIMGAVMDTTTFAIINGLLVMPLKAWPTMCIHKANHASWELDPAAQAALGPTLAKWLAAGNLELVLFGNTMPLYIEPCGAVKKSSPPWNRLITDGRVGNWIYAPWSVLYHTLRDVALVLFRCDFIFCKDIANAYHTAAFAGCGQGIIIENATFFDASGRKGVREQRFIGCSPRTCSGACDKCFSGIMLFWCVFRFACCQFGKATAHGPLNAYVQCLIRYFASLPEPISVQAWVDDLLASVRGVVHDFCNGLAGGCAQCAENKEAATRAFETFCSICRQLHVWFSDGKGFAPDQIGEFTGIIINTVLGLFSVSPAKLENIVECLLEIRGLTTVSRRMLGRGRGKTGHYSQAIPSLAQVIPVFTAAIGEGVEGDVNWDGMVPVSPKLTLAINYVIDTIRTCGLRGRPMWPLPPSSAYRLFLEGGAAGLKVATVVWDSSPAGWGAVIRTNAAEEGKLVIGTFEATVGREFEHQVRRETRGGVLAFRAAVQEFDLRGWMVILRNDATGALATLRKGCSRSEFMQDQAMELVTIARDQQIELLFLHAPGSALIAEQVDAASREGVREVRGAAAVGLLKDAVWSLAASLGWTISIDLFASNENRLVPRFFAWYAEPDAEGVDALSQTSWHSSRCPHCHQQHREIFYAFPPQALIPGFIRKATADRARGIVIVPHAISAPYWSRLRQASVTGTDGPWKSFKDPSKVLRHAGSFRPQALAVFAVDFRSAADPPDSGVRPPCGQEGCQRRLRTWELPVDHIDRSRIDARLRDLVAQRRESEGER